MPTLSPPATILVTGANGYVGCWVVRALLEKRYTVLGAVRTKEKADALFALITSKHPSRARAFNCLVIPDVAVEDAVDPFLEGVHGVVHTATPVTFALEDPEAYIRPAVNGTMGILRAAAKHKDIKRIVITSSIGAIAETVLEETRIYTEEDWNVFAVEQVGELGEAATGVWKYDASKVLAEQAAWKFYEDNKDTLSYELSTIVPGWILGPLPDDPSSPAAFTTPSPILEWKQLFEVPPPENPSPVIFNYVDIRDVTEMHVRALELPEAAGQRFTAVSLVCTWQNWLNAAQEHNLLPSLEKIHPVVAEDKDALPPHPIFSNDKAQRLLGITFKTIPETLRDLIADFGGRGWLKHLHASV